MVQKSDGWSGELSFWKQRDSEIPNFAKVQAVKLGNILGEGAENVFNRV